MAEFAKAAASPLGESAESRAGPTLRIERYSFSAACYASTRTGSVVGKPRTIRVFNRGAFLDLFREGASKEGWIYVDQATKGAWGMSWRQEASKGVEDCEKLGGVVKRMLIPRFPN